MTTSTLQQREQKVLVVIPCPKPPRSVRVQKNTVRKICVLRGTAHGRTDAPPVLVVEGTVPVARTVMTTVLAVTLFLTPRCNARVQKNTVRKTCVLLAMERGRTGVHPAVAVQATALLAATVEVFRTMEILPLDGDATTLLSTDADVRQSFARRIRARKLAAFLQMAAARANVLKPSPPASHQLPNRTTAAMAMALDLHHPPQIQLRILLQVHLQPFRQEQSLIRPAYKFVF